MRASRLLGRVRWGDRVWWRRLRSPKCSWRAPCATFRFCFRLTCVRSCSATSSGRRQSPLRCTCGHALRGATEARTVTVNPMRDAHPRPFVWSRRRVGRRTVPCLRGAGRHWARGTPAALSATVRRNRVFEDGFTQLNAAGGSLKQRLTITFVSELGYPEPGIDGGGTECRWSGKRTGWAAYAYATQAPADAIASTLACTPAWATGVTKEFMNA